MQLSNIEPNRLHGFDPDALQRARTEIEYLRRWYAVATDALGKADEPQSIDEGKRIYHRIFTADAEVDVVGGEGEPLQATGPDGWAAVAMKALQEYEATQHLIGTQVVDVLELETAGDGTEPVKGRAVMNSYLQAWHAWPDQRMRLVLGTYTDHLRYVPSIGWQIEKMTLTYVSGEERMLGS
ncbi:MAG: nuclear transport factor 2 family protein [Pseudomonadales bacterium]